MLNHWLVASHEDEHLDFKEAKNQYNYDKLLCYCVAFANEKGGRLVLGVTDKIPRKVVGTNAFPDLNDIKTKILSALNIRVDIHVLPHPDGRVLVFEIPSRPIGNPLQVGGAYYMRSGEGLVPMTSDQLRKIFAEGKSAFLDDNATSKLNADEVVAELDIQSFFDLMKLPLPATRDAILERLISEKLVRSNGGNFFITNLGGILLAKDLRHFDSLQRKSIRVIKYRSNNKLETERDHIIYKGYASGFEDLIEYINGQLPMNEIIGAALRKEVRMYPEIVIRELVANALIHQDFDQTGTSVMIEIFSDRVEITNPGQPLIMADRFLDAYQPRNERLADIMRRMGICEEKGSGIDKVVLNTEHYQLPAPDFRVKPYHTTAVLFAYKDFDLMTAADRIRACYLHCCLKYVNNESMTNQSLRERFKLEDTRTKAVTVSQIIAAAIEQNQIKPGDPESASKRYARYLPFWA